MATVNFQLNCAVYSCNIPHSLQLIGSIVHIEATNHLLDTVYRLFILCSC